MLAPPPLIEAILPLLSTRKDRVDGGLDAEAYLQPRSIGKKSRAHRNIRYSPSLRRWYYDGARTVDGLFHVGGGTVNAIKSGHGKMGEYNGSSLVPRKHELLYRRLLHPPASRVTAQTILPMRLEKREDSDSGCVRMVGMAPLLCAQGPPCR